MSGRMYHTSPMANRDSIAALGLRASWDPEVDREPGVFLTGEPDHRFLQQHPDHDLYAVDTSGLEVKPDPWGEVNGTADDLYGHAGGSWYVARDIAPERVSRRESLL